MRLAGNAGHKKIANKSPSAHHPTFFGLYHLYQLRHVLTIGKKLVKQQYLLQVSHNMLNFGILATEIDPVVWGTPANFNGFRVLAALLHGSQVVSVANLCGVEQRAPPMFDRATITLGIGPHSSSFSFITLLLIHRCTCMYTAACALALCQQ